MGLPEGPLGWAGGKSDDVRRRGAVSALGGFCSTEKRDEIKQFFAVHRAPGAERALQQSLEQITSCVEFKQPAIRQHAKGFPAIAIRELGLVNRLAPRCLAERR